MLPSAERLTGEKYGRGSTRGGVRGDEKCRLFGQEIGGVKKKKGFPVKKRERHSSQKRVRKNS